MNAKLVISLLFHFCLITDSIANAEVNSYNDTDDLEFLANIYRKRRLMTIYKDDDSSDNEGFYQELPDTPGHSLARTLADDKKDILGPAAASRSELKSRRKRAVLNWPQNSRLIADMYLLVPLRTPAGFTVPMAIDFPFRILMPNVDFVSLNGGGRSLDHDRLNIFGAVEEMFNMVGVDGRSCVLRAVCERAEAHVLTDGILGEVLTLLLEVSAGVGGDALDDYRDAEYHGRRVGDCQDQYRECPVSIFSWIEE